MPGNFFQKILRRRHHVATLTAEDHERNLIQRSIQISFSDFCADPELDDLRVIHIPLLRLAAPHTGQKLVPRNGAATARNTVPNHFWSRSWSSYRYSSAVFSVWPNHGNDKIPHPTEGTRIQGGLRPR